MASTSSNLTMPANPTHRFSRASDLSQLSDSDIKFSGGGSALVGSRANLANLSSSAAERQRISRVSTLTDLPLPSHLLHQSLIEDPDDEEYYSSFISPAAPLSRAQKYKEGFYNPKYHKPRSRHCHCCLIIFNTRSWSNVVPVFILLLGLVALFLVYPVVSFVTTDHPDPGKGFNAGTGVPAADNSDLSTSTDVLPTATTDPAAVIPAPVPVVPTTTSSTTTDLLGIPIVTTTTTDDNGLPIALPTATTTEDDGGDADTDTDLGLVRPTTTPTRSLDGPLAPLLTNV